MTGPQPRRRAHIRSAAGPRSRCPRWGKAIRCDAAAALTLNRQVFAVVVDERFTSDRAPDTLAGDISRSRLDPDQKVYWLKTYVVVVRSNQRVDQLDPELDSTSDGVVRGRMLQHARPWRGRPRR